jgi:hypothetical protein
MVIEIIGEGGSSEVSVAQSTELRVASAGPAPLSSS